jgi:hypothetical protein
MIIVKTKMKTLPDVCAKCHFYRKAGRNDFRLHPECTATTVRGTANVLRISPTKERAEWCPLREVSDHD